MIEDVCFFCDLWCKNNVNYSYEYSSEMKWDDSYEEVSILEFFWYKLKFCDV